VKRFCELLLFISLLIITLPANASFDVSIFEDSQSEYVGIFDVGHEKNTIFIDIDLTNPERSFDHTNNTQYYYSLIYPDLIVQYPQTTNEYVVPRIWIYYRSEKDALNVSCVEIKIGDKIYSFSIDDFDISMLGERTFSERIGLCIGANSADMIVDWYDAAIAEQNIWVTLIGKSEEVCFAVPKTVIESTAIMFSAYVDAGGYKTLGKGYETPVEVKTEAGVYFDKDTNTSFIVPTGWYYKPPKDTWTVTDATFHWESYDKKATGLIHYGSDDLWSETVEVFGPSIAYGSSREMLDNSIYTKAEIAAQYNVSVDNVRMVKYGDYDYYEVLVEGEIEISGFKLTLPMKYYICIDNGYLYFFMYGGAHEKFGDFELMLESVQHNY